MPRTSEIDDSELLDRLMDVFRRHGYEGASLTLLSEASGLGRASLYHRFPGGKPAMAEAVLDHAEQILADHALGPLHGPGEPRERVRTMAEALGKFYESGRRSCLLDTLSFGGERDAIQERVEALVEGWIAAMARVVRETGLPARAARERAEDAIARIQGSLVLYRATGDTRPFRRTIDALPCILLVKDGE